MMRRQGQSDFMDAVVEEVIKKEAFSIERISNGASRLDPFEGKLSTNVWKISNNKLMKNKNESMDS